MIGTTLGHFRLVDKLGEGGMGEVYRAEDTKLHRDVAIKILPRSLTADPERVARFRSEARALARLNHPHIAGIHELGEQDGTHFLVMEFVPGETLDERIDRAPVPVAEALARAVELARALEAAHARGIVHRDLKPANIKLTPKGGGKVLDFGLAKFFAPAGPSPPGARDRTVVQTPHVTETGLILGTAGYMSPEQVRAEAVDARADIWAFGCVLFEMLAGKRAFGGGDPTRNMASVLTDEPDWRALPPELPPSIRVLLRRCLEKDPDRRLHHAADARLELEDAVAGRPDPPDALPTAARSVPLTQRRGVLAAAAAGLILGALAVLTFWRPQPPLAPPVRAVIAPPEGETFQLHPVYPGPAAISPDATRLVFAAHGPDGDPRLWVRRLDESEPRLLPGTEGATYPFWSPDGAFLAFESDDRLRKIAADGGPVLTITDTEAHSGGDWNAEGTILFTAAGGAIHRVSAGGGDSRPVTEVDRGAGEQRHMHPEFLPDGDRFLFIAVRSEAGASDGYPVMLASVSGDPPREVFRSFSKVEYAAGHAWFTREGVLLAQPVDPATAEPTGPPIAVGENAVRSEWARVNALGYFSVCPRGLIAYHAQASTAPQSRLTWYDRDGSVVGTVGGPKDQYHVALSADGRQAFVQLVNPDSPGFSIWSYDIARERLSRLTFDPNSAGPVPSPDGGRFAFSSNRSGELLVYVQTLGRNDPRPLLEDGLAGYERGRAGDAPEISGAFPLDWSPDGSRLVYCTGFRGAGAGLWAVSPAGGTPVPIQPSPFTEEDAAVSPDGRWIAYTSDASGRYEIYLARFPEGGRAWPVSSRGGIRPEWNPRGGELFFISADYGLTAVEVELDGENPVLGPARRLFSVEGRRHLFAEPGIYAVAPDGERFLVNRVIDSAEPTFLNLIVGWPEEIVVTD